jgi:hypothetical protein
VTESSLFLQNLEVEVICAITTVVVCSSGIASPDSNGSNKPCLFVPSEHMQHNYFFSSCYLCAFNV